MKLFLIHVSNASLKQTGFDTTSWPLFVSQIFMRPRKLICKHCSESVVSHTVCKSAVNSNFVFIEFSNEIMNCVTIHEKTELNNSPYSLQGLVRCYQRHFTCAIKMEGKWVYFDDRWSYQALCGITVQIYEQHSPSKVLGVARQALLRKNFAPYLEIKQLGLTSYPQDF